MDLKVSLLYFDGCPSWEPAQSHLSDALVQVGLANHEVELRRISSLEQAEAEQFRGSPTVLFNGVDPFADPSAPVALACRVYVTDEGLRGSPTVAQLVEALRRWTI